MASLRSRPELFVALALGCAPADDTTPAAAADANAQCDSVDPTAVGLMTSVLFSRATDDGVSEGFDLDGRQSDASDGQGCGVADYIDAAGNTGIDNAFANMLPLLETTEADAVEDILQLAINTGELLLMFEMEDVDDDFDDPCVSFSLLRGSGVPDVGTDGVILGGQTFARNPETPASRVDGVAISDGLVQGAPFELVLPAQILDADLRLELHDGAARVQRHDDGTMSGYFAGAVYSDYLLEIVEHENIAQEVYDVLATLLAVNADLYPDEDGECQAVSVTFGFDAVDAFFYE